MESLTDIFSIYNIEIIIGLFITVILLLILNIISQHRITTMTKKYDRIMDGVDETTLEDVLFQYLEDVKEVKQEIKDTKEVCDDLDKRLKLSVQKVGIIRYNAFDNVGSDLSFSIAMLDDEYNGFVLSSIFGRNECNTYAKPIVSGNSSYKLSTEEIQALDIARKTATAK